MAVITSVLLWANGTPALTPPEPPAKKEVAVVSSEVYPKGVSWMDLLNRDPLLYELASCEGQLNPMARNDGDAKITGYPSLGLLQFQPKTFLNGVKAYNAFPGATDEEILAAIHDPFLQIYVARHMIADGEGRQWTCFSIVQKDGKIVKWRTTSELSSKNLN